MKMKIAFMLFAVSLIPGVALSRTSLSELQQQISQLQAQVSALQEQLAAVQSNTVLQLDGKLSLYNVNGYPTAWFQGVNVQIVNGEGATGIVDGLGNLIVGYNELRPVNSSPESCSSPRITGEAQCEADGYIWGANVCSNGTYTNQADCEAHGYIWSLNHRSGSHNIIVGRRNNYSRFGGLVVGYSNTINGDYASVSGGGRNIAGGSGSFNVANSDASSVSGGSGNNAYGIRSSVSGGHDNVARGGFSSVTGGLLNYAGNASNAYATVSGGKNNWATGDHSSVSGGADNRAYGAGDSVSGGWMRVADGLNQWRAGELVQMH